MLYNLFSAIIYILSFPTFSLWPLAFFSVIPFLRSIEKSKNYKILFLKGMFWGAIVSIALGYSVIIALMDQYNKTIIFSILFMLITIILPFSLLLGTFAIIYRFIFKNNLFFYTLLVPAIWVVIDYLKELVPFLIPWANINYAATPLNIFIQLSDIIGPYGITFIIIMINSLLYYIIKQLDLKIFLEQNSFKDKISTLLNLLISNYKILSSIIIIFIIIIIYGSLRINFFKEHLKSPGLKKSWNKSQIIQGNFSPKSRWDNLNFFHRFETYLGMSSYDKINEKRLIIWPETVLNSPNKFDQFLIKKIIKKTGPNSTLISGGTRFDSYKKAYNSAFSIWGDGKIYVYDKNILLPYSENSPFGKIPWDFYNAPSEFHAGNSDANLLTTCGNAGISICFEVLYPWYIRNSANNGAEFLVNLSNDSWFGKSNEPILQHYSSIWRAVENRKFMIRASNSGISAIISPTGEIIAQSKLFTKQKLAGKFLPLNLQTFYSFSGDLIILLSLLFLIGALGFIIFFEKKPGVGDLIHPL